MKLKVNRRNFIKASALAGGGLMLNFGVLSSCQPSSTNLPPLSPAEDWYTLNGFLKIGDNGQVTIMSPNPEGGQNIKTSMPMIVAEELDINWKDVIVEQAPLNTELYSRQFIGGSNAIRTGWKSLRMAGASARQMLCSAAAQEWDVPVEEISTKSGVLTHQKSGKMFTYGEMASKAAKLPVPEEVKLKEFSDFKIIGTSKKNVDAKKIVTGEPLFGIDVNKEGMLIAMIVHPPAFGLKLKSFDESSVLSMPGIQKVFSIKVLNDEFERQHFDTCAFLEVVAIVGASTWEVMNAKKALKVEWEEFNEYSERKTSYGDATKTVSIPAGLENTTDHNAQMAAMVGEKVEVVRRDGDPEAAFAGAARVIERTYSAPFLAHNCMEPMNFFAHVTPDKAELEGPLQKAELTEHTLSDRLGMPLDKIEIKMTRLGGGYGRRSYANWAIEAALISQKMNAPIKLVYTREDDMSGGIYRPAYQATYRAALDGNNNLLGFHVNAGGIADSPLYANRFPAGAIDNYLAESWTIKSNITIGSFRAPRSNFMASAEQSFLDELAEEMGKDPIDLRIDMLNRAKEKPIGEKNDYDADRYIGVLELVREKSGWGDNSKAKGRGVSAYFCHNSYSAQVLDLNIVDGKPVVEKVCCAIDCGVVVNPDGAINLSEGAIVDGIGNALYGEMTFKDGKTEKKNFDKYRMIRMSEAPKQIEVYFVESIVDPTGLGEPAFPPVFAALANALYQATGSRFYKQPYLGEDRVLG